MKNIDKYRRAMEKNRASDELKRKTLNNINKSKKKNNRWIPVTAFAIIFALSITIYTQKNIDDQKTQIWPDNLQISKKLDLPTVDNSENLTKMIKNTLLTNTAKSQNIEFAESKAEYLENDNLARNDKNDYSETNIQVEGVDEADIVKTDGRFIYNIGENEISITDIQNQDDIKKVASIPFERTESTVFYPNEIYIVDNKLIVICSVSMLLNTVDDDVRLSQNKAKVDIQTITRTTRIIIYDIEDKSNIKLQREVEVSGNYLSSRLIGKNLYLVSNQNIRLYNNIRDGIYSVPEYKDSVSRFEAKKIEYNSIYYFNDTDNTSYMNIVSLNIDDKEEANVYSFLGSGNDMYVSKKNIYVSNRKYKYTMDVPRETITTEIYKFSMNDKNLKYEGKINVNGTLINRFAMDEDNEFFRIAVNNNAIEDEDIENSIYIYDKELKQVGKLEKLAIGERIHSVRFMQNRVYLVTYKTIDPLFVIDLTNPHELKVLGELKIPGVSQYLHPYDQTHLIGIGRNTKEKNGTATDIGMKISLFDVSNVENPIELSSLNIGDNGTFSEIQYNHKALYFDKQNSIIGFQIMLRENAKYFKGAVFYKIDLESGISQAARIADNRDKNYLNAIERIIYVKDRTYTISKKKIISLDRITLEKTNEIEL